MLDLVKIFPSNFLVTTEPVNPGAPEVPPEISVGHFSLENRRTARDRTRECSLPMIDMEGVGKGVRGDGGRVGDLSDNPLIFGRGSGVVGIGGHVTCRHAFVGTVRHGRRVGGLVASEERRL